MKGTTRATPQQCSKCLKVRRFSLLFVVCLVASMTTTVTGQKRVWMIARDATQAEDFIAVQFVDSRRGWVAGDGGIVLRTTDAGATWTTQTLAGIESVSDIYFRTKQDGCLVSGAAILCTTDGGERWAEAERLNSTLFDTLAPELLSISFANRRRGLAVGSLARGDAVVASLVMRTEDGGHTWTRVQVPTKSELIDVDFGSDDAAIIVGADGTILRSIDGGATWTNTRTPTRAALYAIEMRSSRLAWATGERGTILRTTDGGVTWTAVPPPVRSTLLGVRFVNNDDGFCVGRGGVVLATEDGGVTWRRQESGTKRNLFAIHAAKENAWAVGGGGIVLRYER